LNDLGEKGSFKWLREPEGAPDDKTQSSRVCPVEGRHRHAEGSNKKDRRQLEKKKPRAIKMEAEM